LEAQLDAVCEQAAQRELDYKSFLTQALDAEWQGRHQRGIEARLRQARFPWLKTLEQFDFAFQPSLDRQQVRELAGLSFIERTQNVVVLGPPGVGLIVRRYERASVIVTSNKSFVDWGGGLQRQCLGHRHPGPSPSPCDHPQY
jgi:hypothetical protein